MNKGRTAGDVCSRIVAICYAGTVLSDAARQMRREHVGCLVVVEDSAPGKVVVGMLTDRDIVVSVVAADSDPRNLPVVEAMTTDVISAREEDSVLDVLEQMRRRGIRRVPVTGPRGLLVGIVTLDDILETFADEMQAVAGAIRGGPRRESSQRP